MMEKGTSILNQLSESRSDVVGFSRFLRNKKVQPTSIIESAVSQCQQQCAGRHILVFNDTTECNYEDHINFLNKKDPELGPTGNNTDIGFFLHPGLAVDAELGIGIGFSYVKIWNRDFNKQPQTAHKSTIRPIEEKESYRWIDCGLESKKHLSAARQLTIIADRESDIYEEFAFVPDDKTHLLIRSRCDRKLYGSESSLYKTLSGAESKGNYKLKIKANKKTGRLNRETEIEIRYTKVKIAKPKHLTRGKLPAYIELTAIEAQEKAQNAPPEEKPICWRLLTTHSIESIEDALMAIQWYALRWQIELLFGTMKSKGLNIEASEVETGKGLKVLCLLAMLVSLKINQLRQAREDTTGLKADICFTKEQQQIIEPLIKKYEGKTNKQKCNHEKGTLARAVWLIARLGGWKGYASEPMPGIKTMAIGLKQFESITQGWFLSQEMCA